MTSETEMVELVARHIHLSDLQRDFPECSQYDIEMSKGTWAMIGGAENQLYMRYARAALEAMRVPTQAMVAAGERLGAGETFVEECWHDMINAALTNTTTEGE